MSQRNRQERNDRMNATDIAIAITDYIVNSGQNPDEWDVQSAAEYMSSIYDVTDIDEIDSDEFTDILEQFEL